MSHSHFYLFAAGRRRPVANNFICFYYFTLLFVFFLLFELVSTVTYAVQNFSYRLLSLTHTLYTYFIFSFFCILISYLLYLQTYSLLPAYVGGSITHVYTLYFLVESKTLALLRRLLFSFIHKLTHKSKSVHFIQIGTKQTLHFRQYQV